MKSGQTELKIQIPPPPKDITDFSKIQYDRLSKIADYVCDHVNLEVKGVSELKELEELKAWLEDENGALKVLWRKNVKFVSSLRGKLEFELFNGLQNNTPSSIIASRLLLAIPTLHPSHRTTILSLHTPIVKSIKIPSWDELLNDEKSTLKNDEKSILKKELFSKLNKKFFFTGKKKIELVEQAMKVAKEIKEGYKKIDSDIEALNNKIEDMKSSMGLYARFQGANSPIGKLEKILNDLKKIKKNDELDRHLFKINASLTTLLTYKNEKQRRKKVPKLLSDLKNEFNSALKNLESYAKKLNKKKINKVDKNNSEDVSFESLSEKMTEMLALAEIKVVEAEIDIPERIASPTITSSTTSLFSDSSRPSSPSTTENSPFQEEETERLASPSIVEKKPGRKF